MKSMFMLLAVAAGFGLMAGCASSPEHKAASEDLTVTEKNQPVTQGSVKEALPEIKTEVASEPVKRVEKKQEEPFQYLTEMAWETLDEEKGFREASEPSWLTESVAELLKETGKGTVQVILNAEGKIQSIYGQSDQGEYFQWVLGSDKGYVRVEPKGFVTETIIRLKVGHRMGMEKLGLTQRLAVKRFFQDMQGKPLADKLDQYLEEGVVELTFKGLFMNRKLVGPTEILEAKGQLYGQELNFVLD